MILITEWHFLGLDQYWTNSICLKSMDALISDKLILYKLTFALLFCFKSTLEGKWQLFLNLLIDLTNRIKILRNIFIKVWSIKNNNCYTIANFIILVLVHRVFKYELALYFFFQISLAWRVNDGYFLDCSISGLCFNVQFSRHVDKILSFPIFLIAFKCHIHLGGS